MASTPMRVLSRRRGTWSRTVFALRRSGREVRCFCALLDYLIRAREHRRRDREPKSLGGLEVDDQLELSRLQDRQLRRRSTLEDAGYIQTELPKNVRVTLTVAHQESSGDALAR